MATVRTSVEGARGCGYRKAGGIYLVSGGIPRPCGKLPIPLTTCPTCSTKATKKLLDKFPIRY